MVLITGIAGFIGSHLAEKLSRKNVKIIGIDNFNDFYSPAMKKLNWDEVSQKTSAILETGDIRDRDFLDKIFKTYPIDSVIHLAAMAGVRPSLKNPLLYEDVNIKGTLCLLDCMRQYGIKNYVFASSSSVYGENKNVPFREDQKIDTPISFYAATKKACEEINHVYHHLYGIKTINLRFFTVYGPRQRPDLAIHKFTRLIYRNEVVPIYGDGSFSRDFTYIDDIVDGIIKSWEWVIQQKSAYEILNLGESKTISVNETIKMIEKYLGKTAKKQYLPQEPGDVPITYADISKARNLLGYNPSTPMEKGIPLFIEWFLSKNIDKILD